MTRRFIYTRVSTFSQSTSNQTTHLVRSFPDATLVEETASGGKRRPKLEELVGQLKRGDELIISSLDRLGRKTSEILILIEELEEKGVILKSMREGIDYSTIAGRLVTQILVSISEMERAIISERTKMALAAKKEMGITGGRPKKFSDSKIKKAVNLRKQGHTLRSISKITGISIARLHNLLKATPP